MAEGHAVDYYLSKSDYENVLKGLIPKPKLLNLDHRRTLRGFGYPSYEGYDLSLFDLTGRAKQAEASRLQAPTIGDGNFEHLLEDDREAGLQAMEACGIQVPPYQRFDKPNEAKAYVKKTNARYVFKPFTIGGTTQDTATTYVAKNSEDLIKNLDNLWDASKHAPFILQEFVEGKEIGVEGFFNGEDFYLLNGSLEEKRLMNDNKGPNTGCAGVLSFMLKPDARIYTEGLEKAIPMLKQSGFHGIIELTTICTDTQVYALEWGPRFGYNCCSVFSKMYGAGYPELLQSIAIGSAPHVKCDAEFGFSVTISIPPYPTEIRIPKAENISITGIDPEDLEQLCSIYLYDAMLSKDKKSLVTSGNYGYVCAPIGIGGSPEAASAKCDALIERIQIPNLQLRTDISKSTMKRYEFFRACEWI
jgi:phosphoribosylamine--glycine ligase